jgi:hypothetical protein
MTDEIIDFPEFVTQVIAALRASGIDYMIGGALAVWAWGEPRSTMDVDLMVNLPVEAVQKLSEELSARQMLLPSDIILDAVLDDRRTLPLCANHWAGYKADLYLLTPDDDLGQSAFRRRREIDIGAQYGILWVQSPEDLILYKLLYYRISQQTKHPRDIYAVLSAQGDKLDFAYIQAWADRKGLRPVWEELLKNRPTWIR